MLFVSPTYALLEARSNVKITAAYPRKSKRKVRIIADYQRKGESNARITAACPSKGENNVEITAPYPRKGESNVDRIVILRFSPCAPPNCYYQTWFNSRVFKLVGFGE